MSKCTVSLSPVRSFGMFLKGKMLKYLCFSLMSFLFVLFGFDLCHFIGRTALSVTLSLLQSATRAAEALRK